MQIKPHYGLTPPPPLHDESLTPPTIETLFAPLLALATLLSTGTLASASPGHETRGIEIQGTIHKVSTNQDTGRVTGGSHRFQVSAWPDRWLIENTFASGVQSRTFFDGTNIQATLKSTNAPDPGISSKVSELGFAVAPSSVAASNLTISVRPSTGFPFSRAEVNIPWLAFCSGPYLQQAGRLLPPLIADYSFVTVSHGYADVTHQFQDNIGLPRETQVFPRSAADGGRHSSSEPVFIYHVETFTNVGGVNLPLRFHYRQDDPGTGYSYSGTGTVDSVTVSTNTLSGLLDQRYQQTIVDFRFRSPGKGISSIVYHTTNISLSATNDPVLIQKLSQTRENPIGPETRSLPRWVIISALLFMGLLSGFIITILHFKSKGPTE